MTEEKDLTEKQFKTKIYILFAIIVCLIAIAFIMGAVSYGYPKGVNVAKDYYLNYYIPEFCSCINTPSNSFDSNFEYKLIIPDNLFNKTNNNSI